MSDERRFALVTYAPTPGGRPRVGVVIGPTVVGLAGAARAWGGGATRLAGPLETADDLSVLLQSWDETFEALTGLTAWLHRVSLRDERVGPHCAPIGTVHLFPPVLRPSKMLYSAQNYPDHVEEMRQARQAGFNAAPIDESRDFRGDKAGTRPYLFFKAPSALAGATDDIVLPADCPSVDWEVELALVIGRRTRDVRAGAALRHVAGFMTTNDVSCRDLLFRPDRERLRSDWLACKSHDTFAPMGPLFVPRQFVPDHLDLRLHLRVNGETRQDGNTGKLIFSPEEQIEYAADLMTLLPGDILSTGTPGGVGQADGRFLQPGDVVEAEVEGLGRLRNTCVRHLQEVHP